MQHDVGHITLSEDISTKIDLILYELFVAVLWYFYWCLIAPAILPGVALVIWMTELKPEQMDFYT